MGEARSYWKVGGSPQRLGETEGFIVSSTACVEDVVFGRRRGRKDKKVVRMGAHNGYLRLGDPRRVWHATREEQRRMREAFSLESRSFASPGCSCRLSEGDQRAVRKTPSCCFPWGAHILKHFLSWGGEVTSCPHPGRLLMKCG